MIIVDRALEKRQEEQNPVRVGMVGAGYMGRGIALQIATGIRGMELVAISNRNVAEADRAYREAGIDSFQAVSSRAELERSIAAGRCSVTDDPMLIAAADGIDAVIEVTGEIEPGAQVAMEAIGHGKHVVLVNAELDSTIGPMLKVYADRAGVVITNADGDEPGVTMNLYRYVEAIGYRPLMTGNIKGFLDRRRTPKTQEGFAAATGQRPKMVTSFADGTKLSMETCLVANATGFGVARRGMHGHRMAHVKDVLDRFSLEDLMHGGLVEYVLGAEPGTGAFVVGYNDHPTKKRYMSYFKMGEGPLYVFYHPWHLPHLEVPLTVARAVLFHDAAVAPLAGPSTDVITIAKRDLRRGEILDGIGGFTCYGVIENYAVSRRDELLPMGLSEGCRMRRAVRADEPLRYSDVEVPPGRLADKLRAEQDSHFPSGDN
jgi:predicted homoserine dehydrogenase-like protein